MRKRMTLLVATVVMALTMSFSGAAFAASFGPGSSDKGPKDPGAKCHPPGQTVTTPGCK